MATFRFLRSLVRSEPLSAQQQEPSVRQSVSQYQEYGHIENTGKIWTAAGGGFIAGGIAGLTLGVGAAAGVGVGTAEAIAVNASASVVGGVAERTANEALGYDAPSTGGAELGHMGVDAISGGVGGFIGGKIGDKLFPIPNVRREIELLQFASKRSTRAAQIGGASRNAEKQSLFNSLVGGVSGGMKSEGIRFVWDWFQSPSQSSQKKQPTQKCTKSTFNGQDLGEVCTALN